MNLIEDGIDAKVITLGAPRIGNKEYAEYTFGLQADTYRIVHERDEVPSLNEIWEG